MANQLKDVKVGDKIIVHTQYNKYVETIERETKTLLITKYHRFNKETGHVPGMNGYGMIWATPATPEEIEQVSKAVRRRELIHACESIKFSSLLDKQMEMILEIANPKND